MQTVSKDGGASAIVSAPRDSPWVIVLLGLIFLLLGANLVLTFTMRDDVMMTDARASNLQKDHATIMTTLGLKEVIVARQACKEVICNSFAFHTLSAAVQPGLVEIYTPEELSTIDSATRVLVTTLLDPTASPQTRIQAEDGYVQVVGPIVDAALSRLPED